MGTRMHTARRPALRALSISSLLALVAACGTAIPHKDVVAAAQGSGGVAQGGTSGGALTTGGTGGTGVPGAATGSGTTGSGTTGALSTTGGTSTSGTAGGTTSGGSATGTSGATGATAGTAAGGDHSPIIVGTVGNFSGAPGVVNKPSATGVQVWANAVNAAGGIAGHPLKVIVQDDQADPARYRQIIQDLVENKHVIAFVGNGTSTTVQAGTSYLEKVRVPVIGSGDGSPAWQSSKMQFPVVGNADALTYGDMSTAVKQGKNKMALLSCVEASSCSGWAAAAKKYAAKAGMTIVYSATISITQADFTSECLNARNAGATVMAVIADQNTGYRAAASCSQQGYKPSFIAADPADADTQKASLEGEIGAMHTFPFFGVPGNPQADEFSAAIKRYGADTNKSMYLASGWASGKLFQAAFLKGVGTAKPTSKGVLDGLWGLPKGDTLNGLILPINFKREGPATSPTCWYPGFISKGKWVAPDGMKPTCVKL
ncbi:MAG: putative branched-chain amino acid transport system substrate-binding protein precursor [Frankiales bacterium]|nr:putative branched-chain amino acid transport system substrate-binding protein precursor [Frankiales bacterium]